jgi:hypothetical protein
VSRFSFLWRFMSTRHALKTLTEAQKCCGELGKHNRRVSRNHSIHYAEQYQSIDWAIFAWHLVISFFLSDMISKTMWEFHFTFNWIFYWVQFNNNKYQLERIGQFSDVLLPNWLFFVNDPFITLRGENINSFCTLSCRKEICNI